MNRVRISLMIIGMIFVAVFDLNSQIRLDNWVAHTSLVQTQSIDIDLNGRIWAASSGGVYSIKPDGSDYRVFRNIDQMLDIDITTIRIHPVSGKVFAGSKNGYLDIYDNNGNWTHVTDIYNQKFSNPQINDIVFHGDKAFIAGGFGLAVFDLSKMVFIETARRFAGFSTNSPVNRILLDGEKIWIATTGGIASASVNDMLANPANWVGYPSNPGLFETSIIDISIFKGTTYAMSEKFITKLVNDTLREYKSTQDKYTSIYTVNNSLMVYSNIFGLLNSDDKLIEIPHSDFVEGFRPYNFGYKSGYIVKYRNIGIGIFINDIFTNYIPDSPLSNVSNDLSVDKDGILWVATDEDPNGKGFAKFDGKTWKNFTLKEYPQIKANSYNRITTSRDGRIILGSYGNGLLVVEPEGTNYKFRHFDTSNSVLIGLSNAPAYLVCGKPRVDNSGNIWVPMVGNESPGPSLVVFDKDYKSYGFVNPRNSIQRYFASLAIDFYGTKWVGGSRTQGLGMMYLNEKGTLTDRSDDISRMITQNDNSNMPDNTHNYIEVDKSGYVWIGTPRGLPVIANPSSAIASQPNINIRNLNRLIGEQNINYILVDAQNNKWLATNNGILVINPDGSDTVGTINISNSPLPTNEIVSIGYNENTGQMYFGSKMGIYEATSLSVLPSASYNITCYPQPFNIDKDSELIIDGLEDYSDIRIVTPAGILVRKMFVNSKKAIWDGKDENGNKAPNGVYLIMATSSSTKHSAVQKIAVLSGN